MCAEITLLENDDEIIDEIEALRFWFAVLPEDIGEDFTPADNCLCGVNLEAVLNRSGVEWAEYDGGPGIDVYDPILPYQQAGPADDHVFED